MTPTQRLVRHARFRPMTGMRVQIDKGWMIIVRVDDCDTFDAWYEHTLLSDFYDTGNITDIDDTDPATWGCLIDQLEDAFARIDYYADVYMDRSVVVTQHGVPVKPYTNTVTGALLWALAQQTEVKGENNW